MIFVSYHFKTKYGATGFGSCTIDNVERICGPQDVREVRNIIIADNDFGQVTLLSWQHFDRVPVVADVGSLK